MEHTQESGKTNPDDIHFFTIGAGAILDASAVLWTITDRVPKRWTCFNEPDDRDNGESVCHYGWYTEGQSCTILSKNFFASES